MYDLERPFDRLTHHFITRIFQGAGDGDELQFSIPVLLGLLSTPAAFGAIELLGKYSTLRLWLAHARPFDVYRASIPDEYFFITYSMVVTGAVVILKWDRLFPDRQDYDNLAGLPVSTRQIFQASLTALLFLTTLFALDINWAACIVFPYAVTSRYDTFGAFIEFFIAHTAAVLLASFFACFALLSIMGLTMLLAPRRYLRRISIAVRIACALALVGILGTAFTIPGLLLSAQPPDYLSAIPSVWFLDLHQSLLQQGRSLSGTAMFALEMTALALVLALTTYAATYYRQFMRIPEEGGRSAAGGRNRYSVLRRVMDSVILRSPFQRATFHFAVKTLFRSEKHCLLFGTATAIGFFIAVGSASDAFSDPVRPGVDPRLLSISLTIAYFMIVSLRALFDVPTERRANWIFRAIIERHKHEARAVAAKVMIAMIAPWLLVIALPLHVAAWGWTTALLHTAYVLMCSIAFAELLLARFRKIPFTCTHTASKDRVLVMIVLCLLGLSFFASANSRVEAKVLAQPVLFLPFVLGFIALLWVMRLKERDRHPDDRALIFEDRPAPAVQVLDLR